MTRSPNDVLILAYALLLGACAPGAATPAAPRPTMLPQASAVSTRIATLTDADISDIAALLRMEDGRVLDTVVVRQAFASASVEVKRRSVIAAARTGDPAAADVARFALMMNDSNDVAAAAAFALGELADTTDATVAALRRVIQRPNGVTGASAAAYEAAYEAAHALGKIVTPASYATLSEALQDGAPELSSGTVTELLLAIWRHPRQPGTAALVLPFMRSPDTRVRFAAAYALMRVGGAAAMPELLEALRDPAADVRQTAARALRAVFVDSAGLRPAARAALLAALRDSSAHVRINAVRTLGAYQEAQLATPIGALLKDADGNVRISAALALDTLRIGDARALLHAAVLDPANALAVRATALAALTHVSADAGLPLATAWSRDSAWLTRLYGVRAISAAPWERAAPLLRERMGDVDPRIQAEALGAISRADTTTAVDALYVQALGSPDVILRAVAIAALGRHADPAHVSVLMDAYARARPDREKDAALAAVAALARLARGDSAVAHSFFFRFPRSPDPVVRAAVERQLGRGSWGDPRPDSDRPLAFYDGVVRSLVQPALLGSQPRAVIHSAGGNVTIELAVADAPLTVHNFITLAEDGYFARGQFRWHRVVPNFVLQDGDPRGDGSGGPGYAIRDEINQLRYTRGAVGMALSGPDTGGSQFFITHSPQPHLDGAYTIFGYVRDGMHVADRVVQDETINGIEIIR